MDERPKVRKRATEAITKVLSNPPSVITVHPACDMCALNALQSVVGLENSANQKTGQNDSRLIHAIQLLKSIVITGCWPAKRLEKLFESLVNIARTSNTHLKMTVMSVFDEVFVSLANETSSSKIPQMLEVCVPDHDSKYFMLTISGHI